jgi:UDP-4-amino-4,6-dideoxy-N-acetyl-beta-L-altrosamine transaminase
MLKPQSKSDPVATEVLPYGRQWIDEDDIQAVTAVLRSEFLTCGPKVVEFEERFAAMVGAKHAVAVNSATSALHLAVLVTGIAPGDRVITTPNTFLASANCAAFVGATPDFADIDPISYNLDPELLERTWQPDARAVIAVDYAGQPCDMPAIARFARERGALVIEDACHSVGGGIAHDGRVWKLGGHPWADITVFSFHPVKTMTSGEGGMLVTDNDAWADGARRLRSHGMVKAPARFVGLCPELGPQIGSQLAEKGPWYYEMQDLGYNYRITDIQCALALSQLKRLNDFITRRREVVARYNAAFDGLPWLTTPALRDPANRDCASWHLYTVQIAFENIGRTRTQVMDELRQKNIGTQVLYIPVHLQPWYRQRYGYGPGKCPVAEECYRHFLSLPLYPAMTDADVDRVIAAVGDLPTESS